MRIDEPMSWPVRSRTVLGEGRISAFVDEELTTPSGHVITRQYLTHPGAVAVVAWREDRDDIAVLRQYRHPVRMELVEIPAGLLDLDGEEWVVAAQRELAEEAELAGGRWFKLASFMASPGCSTEDVDVLLALDLEPAPGDFVREAEEAEIEVAWFALSDVVDAVLAGELHSPTLVIGVLAAKAALERGLENLVEA